MTAYDHSVTWNLLSRSYHHPVSDSYIRSSDFDNSIVCLQTGFVGTDIEQSPYGCPGMINSPVLKIFSNLVKYHYGSGFRVFTDGYRTKRCHGHEHLFTERTGFNLSDRIKKNIGAGSKVRNQKQYAGGNSHA